MSKSRRSGAAAVYLIQLTAQERDLLLSHVHPLPVRWTIWCRGRHRTRLW